MLPQMFLISVCHCDRINNALTTLANIAALVITSDEHINALLPNNFSSLFLHKSILYAYITLINCYFWLVVIPIILNVHVPKMSILVGIRMIHGVWSKVWKCIIVKYTCMIGFCRNNEKKWLGRGALTCSSLVMTSMAMLVSVVSALLMRLQ